MYASIKKKYLFILPLLLCLFLVGCFSQNSYQKKLNSWLKPSSTLPVLCSTEMVEALVSHIGGQYVKTLALVYGELDPHTYQMVKGDNLKLEQAKIIFCNGLGLEHGPSLHAALEKHPRVIYLGDKIKETDPSEFIYHETTVDPHIWLDLKLFSHCCPHIAHALALVDPAHSDYYYKRCEELVSRLIDFHDDLKKKFALFPAEKRYLVTSHEAFYYFARAYLKEASDDERAWKARFCAPEGLAPESQISLRRLMEIVQYIQDNKVRSAFLEVNVSSDAVYKIQEILLKKGYTLNVPLELLFSDCMPPIGDREEMDATARYFKMIQSNSNLILHQWRLHESE